MSWRFLIRHHSHAEGERCIHIGGEPWLCRRCTFLWPLSVGVMGLQLATHVVPSPLHLPLLLILPLPATLYFIGEQVGWLSYRGATVAWTSLLMAPALGIGLARYLQSKSDPLFWGMVLMFAGPAFVAVVWHHTQSEGGP